MHKRHGTKDNNGTLIHKRSVLISTYKSTNLRDALNKDAMKSPGIPGSCLKMSSTIYGII